MFFDHNRPPFKEVRLDYGKDEEVSGPQRSVMINPRVLEYETLVALNQLLHRYWMKAARIPQSSRPSIRIERQGRD